MSDLSQETQTTNTQNLDIEAARMEAEASNMARQLESITDVALAHLALEDLLRELLSRIRELVKADTAMILLLSEDREYLTVRAVSGLQERLTEEIQIPVGRGVGGRIAAERKALIINDLSQVEVVNPLLLQQKIRSLVGAPLIVEGRIIGVVYVGTTDLQCFTEQGAQLLQRAADRLALAIEHARLYEAVRESEARKSAILEAALDCIITMDYEGRVIDFNPAAEETFGYSRAEATGQFLADLIIPPDLREQHWRGLKRYLESGEGPILSKRIEIRGMRKDGSEFPVELTVIPAQWNGQPFFTGYLQDITDRKQAEQVQAHLAAIVESSDDAIIGKTLEGTITSWNAGAERIYGYTKNEVIGQPVSILMPPERPDEFPQIMRRLRNGERIEHYETVRVTKDGRRLNISLTVSPIKDATGNIVGASAVARDVTEGKRIQEELEESEERYRFLAESIPQIVWTAEPDGANDYFNKRWFDYSGLTFEQSRGTGWQLALHPDDFEYCLSCWQEAFEAGKSYQIEYRLRRADGEYRWHLGRAEPLCDDANNIIKWFGTCTDIDDQKEAQAALRFLADAGAALASSLEYEETLSSVAHLAVPHIADWCVVDIVEDGVIERLATAHINPAKEALAHELEGRYPPDPSAPYGVHYVMRTGQSQILPEISEELLQQGARDEEHLRVLRELGLHSVMIVPLITGGRVLGAITLVAAESKRRYGPDDLETEEEVARRAAQAVENARLHRETEQAREAAEQARQAAEEARQVAEEANRAKDEFLAIISHELRTPLTPMLGWVELLRVGKISKDNAMFTEALESVERNVRAQIQLVNDLLDMSRIVRGGLALTVRPIDLIEAIESALNVMRPAATAKSIQISKQFETATSIISGDPDRLQQVMWNLLSNAIKFTPKGGRVEIRLERVDSQVEITVTDTGQGIPAAFLPHIFERFRQVDSTSTRSMGGLGLGLAIVRHIVEMHGGTVQAESAGEGQGATFRVRLPILAVHAHSTEESTLALNNLKELQANDQAAVPPIPQLSPDLLADLRVLTVEDEADARALIKAALSQYGAEVITASSAAEGLQALQEQRPDVLVADIAMPGEDGYSLIGKVRALDPEQGGNTPAVALTAYVSEGDRVRSLSAGFQNHLSKPVAPAELALAVASLANRTAEIQ